MWVHARVSDAECLLEAFEHAAAVADVGRIVGGALPPQVACHEHGRGLLWPLEELGRVQGGLGRECLVVVRAKDAGLMQCADHEAYRLELCARVGQALFEDGECVHEHLVRHVLDACLVSDFSREEKEAHTQLGCLDGMVLRGDQLVHELKEGADLALPCRLARHAAKEGDGIEDQRREDVSHSVAALDIVLPDGVQQRQMHLHVVCIE